MTECNELQKTLTSEVELLKSKLFNVNMIIDELVKRVELLESKTSK